MTTPVLLQPKKQSPKSLTQAEVQKLLSLLNLEIDILRRRKVFWKISAAKWWERCDKSNPETQKHFHWFSNSRQSYNDTKVEEKKIVSLIKTLKGMR